MVQRYKFESKSQLTHYTINEETGCFQWFKDTNLKVNHNSKTLYSPIIMLFPMVQRYKFESKSQLKNSVLPYYYVVSNGSKIQI